MRSPRLTPCLRSQLATRFEARRHLGEGKLRLAAVFLDDPQRRVVVALGHRIEVVQRPVELLQLGPLEAGVGRRVIAAVLQQEIARGENSVLTALMVLSSPGRRWNAPGRGVPARSRYFTLTLTQRTILDQNYVYDRHDSFTRPIAAAAPIVARTGSGCGARHPLSIYLQLRASIAADRARSNHVPPSSRLQARYGQESIPAEIALNPLSSTCSTTARYAPTCPTRSPMPSSWRSSPPAQSAASLVQPQRVERGRGARRRAPRRLAELAGNQAHVREAPLQPRVARRPRPPAPHRHRPRASGRGPGLPRDVPHRRHRRRARRAERRDGGRIARPGHGYIGGMRNHPEEVAELLGLPPGVFAVFGMCVGRPDPARPADIKPRPPQAVVLHHERYSLDAQDAGIAAYDRAMVRFYAEQKMNVHGTWSVHSSKRIAGPETLSGRHRLVEALKALASRQVIPSSCPQRRIRHAQTRHDAEHRPEGARHQPGQVQIRLHRRDRRRAGGGAPLLPRRRRRRHHRQDHVGLRHGGQRRHLRPRRPLRQPCPPAADARQGVHQVVARLAHVRPKNTTFFAYAATVTARSFKQKNECHGWVGIRPQLHPGAEPSDVVMHVRMLDNDNALQSEALGILGVNSSTAPSSTTTSPSGWWKVRRRARLRAHRGRPHPLLRPLFRGSGEPPDEPAPDPQLAHARGGVQPAGRGGGAGRAPLPQAGDGDARQLRR